MQRHAAVPRNPLDCQVMRGNLRFVISCRAKDIPEPRRLTARGVLCFRMHCTITRSLVQTAHLPS